MSLSVEGKNVLITGGAVRVGAALCRAFMKAGANVMIHCRNSRAEAETLREKLLSEYSVTCEIIVWDFSEPRSVNDFWENLPVCPDILINSASVFSRAVLAEESLEDGMAQMNVNFWAPVEMMKQMYRRCSPAADPCVINMLDQAIVRASSDSFSYSVSKKALAEAVKTAALQFAPRLRVNGICPGPVLPPKGLEHLGMKKTLSVLPLGKPAALDDICDTALFLARNGSMTGAFVFVDCGQSLL